MRLAPVAIYYSYDRELCVQQAQASSRTTHGAKLAVEACALFAAMLQVALRGDVSRVLNDHGFTPDTPELQDVLKNAATASSRSSTSVRGTGYCVDALDAALWCFATTGNYADAVLKAANLGDDADTTAAITGQLAGAVYGVNGIPIQWREAVSEGREISELAGQLVEAGRSAHRGSSA